MWDLEKKNILLLGRSSKYGMEGVLSYVISSLHSRNILGYSRVEVAFMKHTTMLIHLTLAVAQ